MKIARKLSIATTFVIGASALAVAGDGRGFQDKAMSLISAPTTILQQAPCPPQACSVVSKTSEGGPPSTVVAID